MFRLESSREVENRMLELAPYASRQFGGSASPPDRAIFDMRSGHGHQRCQRGGASRPEELGARESLEVGLREIS